MIEARSGHAICNFKNVIYVFGGNSSNDMRSAEKFDFCQTWELIAPLNQGKHKASCIIQKDHIYIAGNYSADIDIYHPETNSYEVISSVLSHLKFSPQMINVSDQLYILHWTDFLRINCDRSKCEQLLTNLPRTRLLDWWSQGPVYFYEGKHYVVNYYAEVYEVTLYPPDIKKVCNDIRKYP